tara:strand:- start:23366 stop:23596 length:231 start_codon:yes stop_codon:yes gene_type:complete
LNKQKSLLEGVEFKQWISMPQSKILYKYIETIIQDEKSIMCDLNSNDKDQLFRDFNNISGRIGCLADLLEELKEIK